MPFPEAELIGLIGYGLVGSRLARSFSGLGVLSMVCDANPEALRHAATALPGIVVVQDEDALLADPRVRAVVMSQPVAGHMSFARKVLETGRHLYAAPSAAFDVDDCRKLQDLATARGMVFTPGFLSQHDPGVARLAGLAQDGSLGRVVSVVARTVAAPETEPEWGDPAAEDIAAILRIVDHVPVVLPPAERGESQADVTVLAFPSGPVAHVFAPKPGSRPMREIVVVGEAATAAWRIDAMGQGVVTVSGGVSRERVEFPRESALEQACAAFVDALRGAIPPSGDKPCWLKALDVLTTLRERRNARQDKPDTSGWAQDAFVHHTSVVDERVTLGEGVRIWHFCHILPDCRIGAHTNVGQNVMIGPGVTVGARCKIQNNVSVYPGVTLEDGVFCGPSMVFTNVHNPRATIPRMDEARATPVRTGATLGANCTIVCGNEIGPYAFVGAGAVVTRPVPSHALVVGNPARRVGWVCRCGVRLDRELQCPACGARYEHAGSGLRGAPGATPETRDATSPEGHP